MLIIINACIVEDVRFFVEPAIACYSITCKVVNPCLIMPSSNLRVFDSNQCVFMCNKVKVLLVYVRSIKPSACYFNWNWLGENGLGM